MNHFAKRTMELELEDESSKGGPELVPVDVTYLPKGKYLIEVFFSPLFKLNFCFWISSDVTYLYMLFSEIYILTNNMLQTGGSSFPDLELNVVHLGDHDFRVEHDGVSMNASIAVYQKVRFSAKLALKQVFFFKYYSVNCGLLWSFLLVLR